MSGAPLDPLVVAQLRGDLAPEDLAALLHFYVLDTEAMLNALTVAEDQGAWHRAAHRLAGGAGGVGASVVEARARALMAEPMPRDRAAVLARLGDEIAASCIALRAAFGDA